MARALSRKFRPGARVVYRPVKMGFGDEPDYGTVPTAHVRMQKHLGIGRHQGESEPHVHVRFDHNGIQWVAERDLRPAPTNRAAGSVRTDRTQLHTTPPRSFTSPGGRRFTTRRDPTQTHAAMWRVYQNGRPVGSIWITRNYGPTPQWQGNVKELVWSGDRPPTGLGFDSGPVLTVEGLLRIWGQKADEVLDWRAGKPVRSIYAGGRIHEASGQPPGVFQRTSPSLPRRGR